jgi:tetratricopeptide (TPR) repeat protein/energy-coupling factor transporter ATP-binding protein EcfA2
MLVEPTIHPFPGLRHFEAGEEHLFFGREGQSEEILRRLRQHRFLAVVGASGSGKSSLVRAGLLPYLHGGFLANTGSHWRIAVLRPGSDPIKNLAAVLDDPAVLGRPADSPGEAAQSSMLLEVSLRRSGLGLIEAVRLARLPEPDHLLVVVDQFEELFRFAGAAGMQRQDDDAAAFVRLLLEASRQREVPIYVVLTMRSDFIGDCARFHGLPEAVTTGLYLIPRMTREQRRSAIIEPVRVGGGSIAPRLVARLLNDVGDDPDQLPIMQHALMRSWDYWKARGDDQRPIDLDDYLHVGGMAEALSQHADEAYDGLPDDRHRNIARRIFQALSEKGLDNREARRPTSVGTLAEVAGAPISDIIRIVEEFRQPGRSFLMPARGIALDASSVVDISHESLIRGWRRLRQWVDEEAESARVYRRLAETAELHAQGIAGLWHDPDLQHALVWRDKERPTPAWGHRYHPGFEPAMAFLQQSGVARDKERQQKEKHRQRVLGTATAALAVMTVLAGFSLLQWREAVKQEQMAQQERVRAEQGLVTFARGASFALSDPDRAMAEYDQAIQSDPTSINYTIRGLVYKDKGDYDRAIADFDQAIRLNPKFAFAFNNRGIAYKGKGDNERAMADYEEARKLDPSYASPSHNLGTEYKAIGDYERAIAYFTEAIERDPKFVFAFNSRGLVFASKGDYDRAIQDYDQAIAISPRYALAFVSRANAYNYGKGLVDRAFADYDRAIAIDPKNTIAYSNRGYAYDRRGDYEHAIADYDHTVALAPEDPVRYDDRGTMYRHKGDYDRAIADYDQAIKLNPKVSETYNNRGIAYYSKGDKERALADYDQAIKLDPKNVRALNNRALIYAGRDDYDRAFQDYDQATALDPKFALAFANRGDAYEIKGDYDRVIQDYDQAIALDPKSANAFITRGRAYLNKRDYDHAIQDNDQAIALDPKSTIAFNNRGLAYANKGDYDQAIQDYNQAIALNPKNALALDNRGYALGKQGKLVEALANYRDALAIRKALVEKDPSNIQRQNELQTSSKYLGGLAYLFVLARDFARALEAADQAISLAPDKKWIHGNRAHALMFLGRADEARVIYLQYRGAKNVLGEKAWETVVLEDFAEMRQKGLTRPLMEEIEKRLAPRG